MEEACPCAPLGAARALRKRCGGAQFHEAVAASAAAGAVTDQAQAAAVDAAGELFEAVAFLAEHGAVVSLIRPRELGEQAVQIDADGLPQVAQLFFVEVQLHGTSPSV